MIAGITGKPGHGKGLLCMDILVEKLTQTNDYIVTNLALRLGPFNAYLAKAFPDKDIDVGARVRLLEHDEVKQFYLYRQPGHDVVATTKQEEKAGVFPDFVTGFAGPVTYIIDEAHVYFDALQWMEIRGSFTYWATQHRKLHCNCYFVTQHLSLIAKRFKVLADTWYECFNYGTLRVLTLFKGPQKFGVRESSKEPPCPADAVTYRSRNKELSECYDTMAGAGLAAAGRPPEVRKTKGLHVIYLGIALACLIPVLAYGPDAVIGWLTRSKSTKEVTKQSFPPHGADRAGGAGQKLVSEGVPSQSSQLTSSVDLYATGYARLGNRVVVQMSDGSTRTDDDNGRPARPARLSFVGRSSADFDGTTYFYRPRLLTLYPPKEKAYTEQEWLSKEAEEKRRKQQLASDEQARSKADSQDPGPPSRVDAIRALFGAGNGVPDGSVISPNPSQLQVPGLPRPRSGL